MVSSWVNKWQNGKTTNMSALYEITYTCLVNVNGPSRPPRLEERTGTEELWLSDEHNSMETARNVFERRYRGQTAKIVNITKVTEY